MEPKKTNTLAIVSIVSAILAVVTFCVCYGGPFPLVSIVTGIIAISQINKEPETQGGKGLAIGGIAISVLMFVTIFVVAFLLGGLAALGALMQNQ